MFPEETRQRQERLSKCIYKLSESVLDVQQKEETKIIKSLQKIYEDGFKHSYSGFFPVIVKILSRDNKYNEDYLLYNLQVIKNTLEIDASEGTNDYGDIYQSFTKLCDHLNLQISQLTYIVQNGEKIDAAEKTLNNTKESMLSVQEDLQAANSEMVSAKKDLEEVNEKTKSLQTELIAVLSIFAAIVLTFSGGFSFLGSVMSSINEAEYYEMVILLAVICGLVMFNTIFLMMYLIAKITQRNIYAKCVIENCSCEKPKKKCSGINRIRKRLPYVFYFNLISVIAIILDCFVWYMDMMGYWFQI